MATDHLPLALHYSLRTTGHRTTSRPATYDVQFTAHDLRLAGLLHANCDLLVYDLLLITYYLLLTPTNLLGSDLGGSPKGFAVKVFWRTPRTELDFAMILEMPMNGLEPIWFPTTARSHQREHLKTRRKTGGKKKKTKGGRRRAEPAARRAQPDPDRGGEGRMP